MNFNLPMRFKYLMSAISLKASGIANALSVQLLGRPVWTEVNFENMSKEGYKKNAIAYSAVNKIARGAGAIHLIVKDGEEEVDDAKHPLVRLLKRPNPTQGGAQFIGNHFGYWLLSGNAYMEAVGPEKVLSWEGDLNKAPTELYTIRPDRTKVVAGKMGIPSGFVYSNAGVTKTYDVDEVTGKGQILHNKFFNPLHDWYGMSPIEAAACGIDLFNQSGASNLSLLQNGMRPSGAMVYEPKDGPGTLSEAAFLRLKQEMKEQYQGAKNNGRPLLLDGGMKWEQMGLNPKDMDWIEGKHVSAREIALVFGVPPQLLGIPGDNTYSNAKEARQALYEDTVLPLLDLFLDDLNNWLCPMFGAEISVGYDEDKIPALAPKREARWTAVNTATFITLNEKRAALDYEPYDSAAVEGPADELYVPAGQLPISMDAMGKDGGADGTGDGTGDGTADPTKPQLDENGKPIPPKLGADGKPVESATSAIGGDVQGTALNGTQTSSLQAIVQAVADGNLPAESAIILVMISNPAADPDKVADMINAAAQFAKDNPKPTPAELAAQMAGASPAPGGMPPGGKPKPGAKPPEPGKKPVPPGAGKPAPVDTGKALEAQLEGMDFSSDQIKELCQAINELGYGK